MKLTAFDPLHINRIVLQLYILTIILPNATVHWLCFTYVYSNSVEISFGHDVGATYYNSGCPYSTLPPKTKQSWLTDGHFYFVVVS